MHRSLKVRNGFSYSYDILDGVIQDQGLYVFIIKVLHELTQRDFCLTFTTTYF